MTEARRKTVFQKILMAALVAAPMMMVPAHVDAQQRGSDQAQAATAQAAPASQHAPRIAPEDLRRIWEGRTPPPALLERFPDLAPQPAPEPEPVPEEECPTTMGIGPDGSLVEIDCHGNVVGIE